MTMGIYIVAAVLGIMGALAVMKYGQLFGLVDIPSDRSSHAKPTPKGGGIGILAAFIVVALWTHISFWFLGPVTVVALISLIGDRIHLSPVFRLIVQFSAAIIVIWSGTVGPIINDPPYNVNLLLWLVVLVFSMVFIVGTANIYNFMDGINGIAGITGIIGFSLLAFYAFSVGDDSSIGLVCVSLAFACLGFLPFNMPKAHVFMGDVGSILLGFVFAVFVSDLSRTWLEFICLCACLFPFYVDELTTMALRVREGERLTRPHRRHLYQILANEMGVAHWKISLGYGLCQLVIGLSAIVLSKDEYISIIFLSLCFIVFMVISNQIRRTLRLDN